MAGPLSPIVDSAKENPVNTRTTTLAPIIVIAVVAAILTAFGSACTLAAQSPLPSRSPLPTPTPALPQGNCLGQCLTAFPEADEAWCSCYCRGGMTGECGTNPWPPEFFQTPAPAQSPLPTPFNSPLPPPVSPCSARCQAAHPEAPAAYFDDLCRRIEQYGSCMAYCEDKAINEPDGYCECWCGDVANGACHYSPFVPPNVYSTGPLRSQPWDLICVTDCQYAHPDKSLQWCQDQCRLGEPTPTPEPVGSYYAPPDCAGYAYVGMWMGKHELFQHESGTYCIGDPAQ
jgi:hypothetical protein